MDSRSALQRVELDIARGDLGKARDRLHGLLSANRDDLDVRAKLAEVYWNLQFPEMAGRYWYLHEPTSDAMREAVATFETRHGGEPIHILHALGVSIRPDTLPGGRARERVRELVEDCSAPHPQALRRMRERQTGVDEASYPTTRWWHKLVPLGCTLLAAIVILIFVLGLWGLMDLLGRMFG